MGRFAPGRRLAAALLFLAMGLWLAAETAGTI